MNVTKEYLKRIIKEEYEKMEEVDVPFSDVGSRPGLPVKHKLPHEFGPQEPERQGPEAAGDVVNQTLYDVKSKLEFMLDYPQHYPGMPERALKDLRILLDKAKGAIHALDDSRFPGSAKMRKPKP